MERKAQNNIADVNNSMEVLEADLIDGLSDEQIAMFPESRPGFRRV